MALPAQHPHRSRQDYGTPPEFLNAVQYRFGQIEWDLAANAEDAVVAGGYHFGPGSAHGDDALAAAGWWAIRGAWATTHHEPIPRCSWLWLNPPFANIGDWAARCAEESRKGARILMLTPASIGTRWFAAHVQPHAHVIALSPRLTFIGESAPYPKDLMLSVYAHGLTGFSTWHWTSRAHDVLDARLVEEETRG